MGPIVIEPYGQTPILLSGYVNLLLKQLENNQK
jgi:hypothetical protein